MKKEFNLSEKITKRANVTHKEVILKEDIKEFIRELKRSLERRFKSMQTEEAKKDNVSCKLLEDLYIKPTFEEIDKLAGKELLE